MTFLSKKGRYEIVYAKRDATKAGSSQQLEVESQTESSLERTSGEGNSSKKTNPGIYVVMNVEEGE